MLYDVNVISVLIHSLLVTQSMMLLTFFVFLLAKNPGVVDFFWSLTIVATIFIIGLQNNILGSEYFIITMFILVFWALRLSLYLLITRILPGHVENRYSLIGKKKQKSNSFYFFNQQFQGLVILLLSSSFLFVGRVAVFSHLYFFSLALSFLAILLEWNADLQLYRFKHQGSKDLIRSGWWAFSRHPNCFFEWLLWLGFSLQAYALGGGWWSFCAALTIFVVMYYITIPVTEKMSLKNRGQEYVGYMNTTNKFFLWKNK